MQILSTSVFSIICIFNLEMEYIPKQEKLHLISDFFLKFWVFHEVPSFAFHTQRRGSHFIFHLDYII